MNMFGQFFGQMIAKLLSKEVLVDELRLRNRRARMMFHSSTPASGRWHGGSNQHNKGVCKTRSKMAARSNRINRRRMGRVWTH